MAHHQNFQHDSGVELDDWLFVCRQHFGPVHFAYHEAGHAVVAAELGIAFGSVMLAPPRHLDGMDNVFAGGVLLEESDPTAWVPQRPEEAADFLLAGSFTESKELGHRIPEGHEGDLRILRIGMGWTGSSDGAEARPLLYGSMARLRAAMPARRPAIQRVAEALIGKIPRLEEIDSWDQPVELSADEVLELVQASTDAADPLPGP